MTQPQLVDQIEAETNVATSQCDRLMRLVRHSRYGPSWQPTWRDIEVAEQLCLDIRRRIDVLIAASKEFENAYSRNLQQLREQYVPQRVYTIKKAIKQLKRLAEAIDQNETKRAIHVLNGMSLDAIIKRKRRKEIEHYTICKSQKMLFEVQTHRASKHYLPGTGRDKQRDEYIDEYNRGRERLLSFCRDLIANLRQEVERTYDSDPDNLCRRALETLGDDVATIDRCRSELKSLVSKASELLRQADEFANLVDKLHQVGDDDVSDFFFRSPSLSDLDCQLVNLWLRGQRMVNIDYWKDALASARKAEICAKNIYLDLYAQCRDLSIMQVDNSRDDRWRLADIETESGLVDVKNARSTYGNDRDTFVYSEHLIPEFKEDRSGNNVTLSTFYTDYHSGEILWLGETTQCAIQSILDHKWSTYLEVQLRIDGSKTFIPPWLCDYPDKVYEDRDALIRQVQNEISLGSTPADCLDLSDAIILGLIPGQDMNIHATSTVLQEGYLLQNRVRELGLLRPVVYLHVLSRFADATAKGQAFNSSDLLNIIKSHCAPLYIADPAKSIFTLIHILDSVQRKSGELLNSFKYFRLCHPQILQGVRVDDRIQTILAYCGGWNRSGGASGPKCGQYPLYLGKHDPCPECGKLVCDKCGYCSNECVLNAERQRGIR